MKLSALTSSLPMELPAAIEAIADLGFHWVDIPPATDAVVGQTLKARELRVACVALERNAPANIDLASSDAAIRRHSLDYFRHAIGRTAELGAPVAYLTPPATTDVSAFGRWTESVGRLADTGETHGIRLWTTPKPSEKGASSDYLAVLAAENVARRPSHDLARVRTATGMIMPPQPTAAPQGSGRVGVRRLQACLCTPFWRPKT